MNARENYTYPVEIKIFLVTALLVLSPSFIFAEILPASNTSTLMAQTQDWFLTADPNLNVNFDNSERIPPPPLIIQESAVDGFAEWNEIDGFTVNDWGNYISIQQIDWAGIDKRGLLEFDLDSIPDDAKILSAKLTMEVSVLCASEDSRPSLIFYGYAGEGVLSPNDALNTERAVGASGIISFLDQYDFQIDPAYVESLLMDHTHLGIVIVSVPESYECLSFYSNEMRRDHVGPTLTVEYDFFDAGDINRDYRVDIGDLAEMSVAWLSDQNMDAFNFYCDISPVRDGLVDMEDLRVLVDDWLETRLN